MKPKLRVAWWNTSLNPPVRRKKVNTHLVMIDVYRVLKWLMKRYDLIFLGEFAAWAVLDRCPGWKYRAFAGLPACGLNMNLGVLYKTRKVHDIDVSDMESYDTLVSTQRIQCRKKYRVGVKVRVGLKSLGATVDCYVLHWRNYAEANSDFVKDKAAAILCGYVNLFTDSNVKICLGDFNVEPWASSLSVLCASRSKEYVKRYGGFYNPFWRFLNEDNGSFNYLEHQRLLASKLMFDQMLVHYSFWDNYPKGSIAAKIECPKVLPFGTGCHAPIGIKISFK